MRITENSNYELIRENMRKSRERLENLQNQYASTKKLNLPSDDPVGASKLLEIRTDKARNDQFQTNGKLVEAFLENTDSALGDLSEVVLRAKEIALGQSSAASTSDSARLGVAEEVSQLYRQAVSIANRKVGDRYIFGGFQTQRPPINSEGNYCGDTGQMMIEIAGNVFITMNIPGVEAFNTHPNSVNSGQQYTESDFNSISSDDPELENVNVFDELQNFRISLLTGNTESIRNTLDRFDQIYGKLVAVRSKVGSRIQSVRSTSQAIERHNITHSMLSSSLEDADMAQVASDLGKEEMVFRSSLASAKRLMQPTLLDFLR